MTPSYTSSYVTSYESSYAVSLLGSRGGFGKPSRAVWRCGASSPLRACVVGGVTDHKFSIPAEGGPLTGSGGFGQSFGDGCVVRNFIRHRRLSATGRVREGSSR